MLIKTIAVTILVALNAGSARAKAGLECKDDEIWVVRRGGMARLEKVGCGWVAEKKRRIDKYCRHSDFQDHCPVTCDMCGKTGKETCSNNTRKTKSGKERLTWGWERQCEKLRCCEWQKKKKRCRATRKYRKDGRLCFEELTVKPSGSPSDSPTLRNSDLPSASPTDKPTGSPSAGPSASPTLKPTASPSDPPTPWHSELPSAILTVFPSADPSVALSPSPSDSPSALPSDLPSFLPSLKPSGQSTTTPTMDPSADPTTVPSTSPSDSPSLWRSDSPSTPPTGKPTASPSTSPSASPTGKPSAPPSPSPTASPTMKPTPDPCDSFQKKNRRYSSWFSEENFNLGEVGGPIDRMYCRGSRCDEKRAWYWSLSSSDIEYQASWSGWFSEEGIGRKYCPSDMFVDFVRCSGDNCDNINLRCRKFRSTGHYHFTSFGYWTSQFSEERGKGDCGSNGAVVGMECDGKDCDNIKLYCRRWGVKPQFSSCRRL